MEGFPLLKQYVRRKGCKVWAEVCCGVCGRVSYGSCAKLSPSVTVCDARDDLSRSLVTIPANTTITATAIPTTFAIIIEEPGNSTLLALSRTHLGGAGKYRLSESFNQATFLVSTDMKKKYL